MQNKLGGYGSDRADAGAGSRLQLRDRRRVCHTARYAASLSAAHPFTPPCSSARQLRDREDNKRRKQAATQTWALQQVRLLVDSALVSNAALGVSLLSELGGCWACYPCWAVLCCAGSLCLRQSAACSTCLLVDVPPVHAGAPPCRQ